MRDEDYELEQIFKHFEKLVEKERKRKVKSSGQQPQEKGKKEDTRYIRHDRD